jgi:hypothetical protein
MTHVFSICRVVTNIFLSQSQSQSYITTDGQSDSLSWCQTPICGPWPEFVLPSGSKGFFDVRHPLWREDGSVVYNCCWLRQRSHSPVLVPRDSRLCFTISDSSFSKPGGLGPHIYIPQEQGGPVAPPGTGFYFHRILLLAGLLWRYLNGL